jgi:hypothetical protein
MLNTDEMQILNFFFKAKQRRGRSEERGGG